MADSPSLPFDEPQSWMTVDCPPGDVAGLLSVFGIGDNDGKDLVLGVRIEFLFLILREAYPIRVSHASPIMLTVTTVLSTTQGLGQYRI
jgi:hypothetical protein